MNIILTGFPINISNQLIAEYIEIKKRYSMSDWGPGQLKGGRFAEVVLRIFQHILGDSLTPFGTDIPSAEKTRILNRVQSHATIDEHIRQKTTALTRLLLDFRNSRDAAHLGGFNANDMDALFVMTSCTWMLCELIRVYGGYSMPDAQRMVDGLATKDYPVLMEFDGDVFITRPGLTAKQEVLIILNKQQADFDFLFSKTKDNNSSRFRSTLDTMVKEKLIGHKDDKYFLMPKGFEIIQKDSLLTYV